MSVSHIRQPCPSVMSVSHVRQSWPSVISDSHEPVSHGPVSHGLFSHRPVSHGSLLVWFAYICLFAVCMDRMTDRATSIRQYRLTSRSTNQPTNRRTGRQTYRSTDTQRDKQTNVRLTNTNRQIDKFYRCYKLTNITDK